jgi:hypothetical protein
MKKLILIVALLATATAYGSLRFYDGDAVDLGHAVIAKCGLGLDCAVVSEQMYMKQSFEAAETFTDSDATPDVSGALHFETNTSAVTITDFDGSGIYEGQLIIVVSKGAITYDVTSSGIVGGSTDIITAAGDVTSFLYDGADWLVTSRIDLSDDLN